MANLFKTQQDSRFYGNDFDIKHPFSPMTHVDDQLVSEV